MRYGTRTSHVALLAALLGTTLLAACGGGGHNASVPPVSPQAPAQQGQSKLAQGKVTAIIPSATTPQSGKRSPKYLNTSDPNSAIVISVMPTDPAEAAQWSTLYGTSGFTLCYNLYTNGTPNPALNPVAVPGGVQVSFQIPAVPGNDAFSITQYDGQCSPTNPYIPPVPSPNANGNGVLASAPPITININGGLVNDFNVQLTACGAPSSTGGPCSNATPAPGTPPTTVQLGATVASVYLAGSTPAPRSLAAAIPIPIVQPIRELGSFVMAGNHVGVPIPVVGLDSAGFVIAGSPATGTGQLPKVGDKIQVSHNEYPTSGHANLYLVDATTGAIAQTEAPGSPITLTQLNALNAADNVSGLGTPGDPYVVVLSTDGSNATGYLWSSVFLNATINGAAIPTQQSTVREQGALFTANYGPTGYTDAGGPYGSASQIVSTFGSGLPGAASGLWVPTNGAMAEIGVGQWPVAGGALNLQGAAYDANASVKQIFVVDFGATLGSLQTTPQTNATASGLYMFDPVTHASLPVAVQYAQTNSYIGFQNPQAVIYMPGGYLYVVESGRVWAIDPQANGAGTGVTTVTTSGVTYVQAEAILQLPVSGLNGSAALSLGGVGIPPSTLLLGDPNNKRIASINVNTGAVATFASGDYFVGITQGPVAGTYYSGTLGGQIWKITGGVPTSFGLQTVAQPSGAPPDGPAGIGATLPFGTPSPYALQGTAASFFGSASTPTLPYSLAPFNPAGPVFAPAAQTALAGGALNLAADTNAQNITATQVGKTQAVMSVFYVTSAMAAGNAALTPESFLITDTGTLRTLVP
ncbi:MAG: hypothetical protein JWN27_4065 [Candidatus Eremiobacteraeota bacterium]|nr:hypothetical protein [Candidatus Eremiobacteraeota bacterium]